MTKKRNLQFHITGPARRDIAAILKWSVQEFGMAASLRYRALIRQALLDIEADSNQPGSIERPDLLVEGARTYHISLSQSRAPGTRVREPRHFLLYRRHRNGVIEVGRILHDCRDLARHLPVATAARTPTLRQCDGTTS